MTTESESSDYSDLYVRPHQMDRLRDLGYLGDEAWEKYQTAGLVTVENADGDPVILCPDMWEAPDTIGPIVSALGKRDVKPYDKDPSQR